MPSPDKTATVVLSATLTESPKGGFIDIPVLSGSTGHYEGSFYLEVFDAASRARLAAAEGHYDDRFNDGGRETQSAWIGSRVFLLPLDLLKMNWLAVVVPAPTN